ncbi:unnamed protein product [Gadus morhua 'NCC']
MGLLRSWIGEEVCEGLRTHTLSPNTRNLSFTVLTSIPSLLPFHPVLRAFPSRPFLSLCPFLLPSILIPFPHLVSFPSSLSPFLHSTIKTRTTCVLFEPHLTMSISKVVALHTAAQPYRKKTEVSGMKPVPATNRKAPH